MTARPRVKSSTSYLRSNVRDRIKTLRKIKRSPVVGKAEVLQHFEPTRSADTRVISPSKSVVRPNPGVPVVVPIEVRPRTKTRQRLPALLLDIVKRANPLN